MSQLIPVAQWTWILFRVTYHLDDSENAPALFTRYIVSTDTHIQSQVCDGDYWPSSRCTFARWEPVEDRVERPRQIGAIYGHRIDESGWAAGEREAERRGLAIAA